MGKRSAGKFERSKNDLYDTPEKGVIPLLPFLRPGTRFIEPCFGNGHLAEHLMARGHVLIGAYDIDPRFEHVIKADARTYRFIGSFLRVENADCFITNPPWTRRFETGRDPKGKIIWEEVLHPLLANLSDQLPLWALFDADWIHTEQAMPLVDRCSHVVSVGRLKWIPGTKHSGVDNAAWYRFHHHHRGGPRFFTRAKAVDNDVGEICDPARAPFIQKDPQHLSEENKARFERAISELSPLPSDQQQQGYKDSRFS